MRGRAELSYSDSHLIICHLWRNIIPGDGCRFSQETFCLVTAGRTQTATAAAAATTTTRMNSIHSSVSVSHDRPTVESAAAAEKTMARPWKQSTCTEPSVCVRFITRGHTWTFRPAGVTAARRQLEVTQVQVDSQVIKCCLCTSSLGYPKHPSSQTELAPSAVQILLNVKATRHRDRR